MEQRTLDGERGSCDCVARHSPAPHVLHLHHLWPLGDGGPDTPENLVVLCPSAHENFHRLWRAYKRYEGKPPKSVEAMFSPFTRRLVHRAWSKFKADR